jgi:tetratricopeptide (TPR) repeat protein
MSPDPFEPYLRQAEELYTGGDIVKAGQIWQAILKRVPGHAQAKAGLYKVKLHFDARATQGDLVPKDVGGQGLTQPRPTSPEPEPEDPDTLLQCGCTLFDMGQLEEARVKWERLLARDPFHVQARQYVAEVRRQLDLEPLDLPPLGEPTAEAVPDEASPDRLERCLREGVQLFDMGMAREALAKWQVVLDEVPDHANALEYRAMALRELGGPPAAPPPPPPIPPPPVYRPIEPLPLPERELPPPELAPWSPVPDNLPPEPAALPAAIVAPTAIRKGLEPPAALRQVELPDWASRPSFWAAVAGVILLGLAGTLALRHYFREARLRADVTAAKLAAQAIVARSTQIANLEETPENLRREAEAAFPEEPLLGYLRAQALLRIQPDNPVGTQLLDRGRSLLAAQPAEGTLRDVDRLVQEGNLEGARKRLLGLLAQSPDDPGLRLRASRLSVHLAQSYAAQERWQDARDELRFIHALYPDEKVWLVRIQLLEPISRMPKPERAAWIQMLG